MDDDQLQLLNQYFTLMNINGAAHVYREAVDCGLLDALVKQPMTVDQAAAACGLRKRPVRLVLEALKPIGLVSEQDSQYAASPLTGMLLSGPYRQLGDAYWAHLPSFLRSDEPIVKMDDPAQSEQHYQAQAAALAWMLAPAAEAAAIVLTSSLSDSEMTVLDVGAGSAIWSLTLATRHPRLRVTAVDWPAVLLVAMATAQRMGVADRLTTVPGDYHQIELPRDTDMAILGNVTHLETEDGNRTLIKKIAASVKPGGRLVVFDIFPGRSHGDLNRTLYALGLALRTEQGQVHSPDALEKIIQEAGFAAPRLTVLDVPPYAIGMLVADQPA